MSVQLFSCGTNTCDTRNPFSLSISLSLSLGNLFGEMCISTLTRHSVTNNCPLWGSRVFCMCVCVCVCVCVTDRNITYAHTTSHVYVSCVLSHAKCPLKQLGASFDLHTNCWCICKTVWMSEDNSRVPPLLSTRSVNVSLAKSPTYPCVCLLILIWLIQTHGPHWGSQGDTKLEELGGKEGAVLVSNEGIKEVKTWRKVPSFALSLSLKEILICYTVL